MTLINTAWSTEGLYFKAINIYTSALECIWHETTTNEVDAEDNPFETAQTDLPPELKQEQLKAVKIKRDQRVA
jgi:hypothetical protein